MKNGNQSTFLHSSVYAHTEAMHQHGAPCTGVVRTQSETLEHPGATAKTDASRQILIIEDDQAIAEALSIRLERQGYEPLLASTGRKALELAHLHRPHLVLLDLHLPDVDGFSVCNELNETPATCDIPVIMLSGMEGPDIIRRARAVGCYYYVRKPYDPNALLVLIKQAIREREEFEVC